jgi:hypothetical protein
MLGFVLATAALAQTPNFGPGFNASTQPNMNGEFVLSQTPGGDMSKFPKAYKCVSYNGQLFFVDHIH